ncbi:hypothetical protein TWF718_004054 [Orbilia javanica]|uniref:Uncharacterized protein n=1 Tax=Orbilia javanica TaxID=47235 RepID=A0AAN8N1X2_9PEZI
MDPLISNQMRRILGCFIVISEHSVPQFITRLPSLHLAHEYTTTKSDFGDCELDDFEGEPLIAPIASVLDVFNVSIFCFPNFMAEKKYPFIFSKEVFANTTTLGLPREGYALSRGSGQFYQ